MFSRSAVLGLTFLLLFWGRVLPVRAAGDAAALEVPRGYVDVIEIEQGDRIISFGPLVGYYFSPVESGNLSRLRYVVFNERRFYTRDLPENAKLYEGEAVLQTLAESDFVVPVDDRINPILFEEAPVVWLEERPEPQAEFLHFHSCYDALGSVRTGYWLRHRAVASFTYDLGGRVGPGSILYHQVEPGVDTAFARILEFDKGPALAAE